MHDSPVPLNQARVCRTRCKHCPEFKSRRVKDVAIQKQLEELRQKGFNEKEPEELRPEELRAEKEPDELRLEKELEDIQPETSCCSSLQEPKPGYNSKGRKLCPHGRWCR